MSTRSDVVNLTVNVNGNDGLNEMNKLRKTAADIKSEMSGLKKNTEEYIKKAEELKAVESKMGDLRKTIGLTALNQKELISELKRLQMLKNTVTPQTKEFFELQKQIEAVNNRLYEVKNGVFGVGATFHKIKDEVKQFGVMALSYLGFEFISDQMRQIITNGGRMSDQLADIRRAAGLTAPEVQHLQEQLRELNTRTSNSALLDIAIVAGKLGVSKTEIAGFTKEIDRLLVALGDELGDADQITTTLGKILNVFDGEVKADNIGRLGNAIVELANNGVASGPFITDFAQRVAGISKASGVSLSATLAFGAGLEELGLRSESSSTAFQKLLSVIASDIPSAAKVAGVPLKEFNEMFAFNAQEALIKYAEGLVKNKKSFSEVTQAIAESGEEGARVVQTLQAIGQKGDFLREKINLASDAIQSTSAITDAYALKNENLGGTLDKIGKKLASSFTSTTFITALNNLAEGFAKLIGATESENQALDEFKRKQEQVNRLERDMIPLINRYDELERKAFELGGTTKLSKDEQVELNKAIQTIASGIPYAITQFDDYGKAIAISSDNAREFIRLQQLVLKEKNRDAITDQKDKLDDLQRELHDATLNLKNAESIMDRIKKNPNMYSSDYIDFATAKLTEFGAKVGAIQDRISGVKGLIKDLSGDDLLNMLNEKTTPTNTPGTGLNVGAPSGGSDKSKDKVLDERKKALEKFLNDIKRLKDEHRQAELAGDELEIDKIQVKYRALYDEAKKYNFDTIELSKYEAAEIQKIKDRRDETIKNDVRKFHDWEILQEEKALEEKKKKYEESIKTIEELDEKELKATTDRLWEKRKKELDHIEEIKEAKKKALGDLLDAQYAMFTSYDNLVSMIEQNDLDESTAANNKKKRDYEEMLKSKIISQSEFNKKVDLLDKESEARKKEIEIKQMERRKKMSIMQALINGAEGITKIWATYAAVPYIAAILTAMEVAAVGTQVAAISQQQVPKAEDGMRIRGKRHRDGGTMINAEDGEVILSRNTVSNNQTLVDRLLWSSQNRNGASISSYNVLPTFTSSTTGSNGGYNANATDPYIGEALMHVAKQQERTNEILMSLPTRWRAYMTLQELQQAQHDYNTIIKESGLNQ